MEINEVKVGDMVTYKNKQGKQVKGKVIHRHSGKDASHLTGHVNIQNIGGVPSFPVTIHVSDIKPHITEETDMQDENVYTMIDSIQTGDTDRTETLFREIMNTKIANVLASKKEEVAKSMFNTNECADCEAEEVDEALKGNQHKIDANKNGKVDAHDFKLLRKKKGVKEEVEQVDEDTFEQGGKTKMDFKTPRHVSPHFKYLKKLSPAEEKADMLKRAGLKDVSKKPPAVKKEEVAHEAYSDPYAAKKSAEMKKAHAATMADAKKEYDAARKPKFAKNFMKMKKEDVELEEGNAENKMKKNAYADAKGAANKYGALDRGSQRRVDRQRTDEVDSIKKGIDNYAPKKAAVRNIIRGKVFGKLSDTETKIFARKRVKEDVNMQELHVDTLSSYLGKRSAPPKVAPQDMFRRKQYTPDELRVAKKRQKGKDNAFASIVKKTASPARDAYDNAAAASYNKTKPGTYNGD